DMLKKLKTSGVRSGIPRRYVLTYELYGLLTNKVRDVLDQMDEISQSEVQKANLSVKMQGEGDIDASSIAKAVGRENDEDFIMKLQSAAETANQPEPEEEEDGKHDQVAGEIEKLLTRDELKELLKNVISGLDRFRWQDMANEFKKWLTVGETSDNVMRRLLEDTAKLLAKCLQHAGGVYCKWREVLPVLPGFFIEEEFEQLGSGRGRITVFGNMETESAFVDSQPTTTTVNMSDMEKVRHHCFQ
ncbi:URC1, partial [Symbiodinium pilosum]